MHLEKDLERPSKKLHLEKPSHQGNFGNRNIPQIFLFSKLSFWFILDLQFLAYIVSNTACYSLSIVFNFYAFPLSPAKLPNKIEPYLTDDPWTRRFRNVQLKMIFHETDSLKEALVYKYTCIPVSLLWGTVPPKRFIWSEHWG